MIRRTAMANLRRDTEIRAVIEDWAEGIRHKDAARVVAHGAADFRQFSLAPPLIADDTGIDGLNRWFVCETTASQSVLQMNDELRARRALVASDSQITPAAPL